jgi:RIO kinase 1
LEETLPEHANGLPELELFIDELWITDVLYELKSGKEATAFCCAGGPTSGVDLVAAKLYRPLETRGFRNDAAYQAGRTNGMKRRERVAFEGKSRVGLQMRFSSWVEHEYRTLELLHAAGTAVPRPLTKSNDVILMAFIGDEDGPAPALKDVRLAPHEARRHFDALLADIETWLACDRVHGDLSPYNILYWDEQLVTIDFPQAADPSSNPNAYALLERDIANVCRYFAGYGIRADPERIASDLWMRWRFGELRARRAMLEPTR